MEEDLLLLLLYFRPVCCLPARLETASQASAICHGKVPNETQALQALKFTPKRKTKTKILRLLSTGAEPETETSQKFT